MTKERDAHRAVLNTVAKITGMPELTDELEVPEYVGRALNLMLVALDLMPAQRAKLEQSK